MAGVAGRHLRPLRVLFAFLWAVVGAGGAGLALVEKANSLGIPTVTDADRPYVLAASGGAIVIALLLAATARRGDATRPQSGAGTRRRRRPLRMLVGVASGVAGGMALATSELSIEPALMAGGLTGGGAFSLLVSFWSFLTAKRRAAGDASGASRSVATEPAREDGDPAARPTIALEPDLVAHQLRDSGWFVVAGMHLEMSYADYVAVGPAGVLAIQTFWTDVSEDGNGVRARARVAARKVRDVLHQHEIPVEVVPVVLVCGPLPDEVTEAVAVVDDVAVLVARRSDQWLAELRQSNALGRERFEAVRTLFSETDPAELARA